MKAMMNSAARYTWNPHFGLLFIRVATGLVFFMHGWSKVNNLAMMQQMLGGLGLAAGVVTFLAWLEVIGGLALILGIATRFFALAFGIEMLVAIMMTGGIGRGYQPHELELILMLISFGVALSGSGRYSLYKMECDDCGGIICEEHRK